MSWGIGLEEGQNIDVNGHKFKIARILPEFGGLQDVQLVVHLHDAQKIVEKEGMINQIMALNCKCKGDRISIVRKELEGVLPDTKVTEHLTRATARETQRDLVEKQRSQQIALVNGNLDRANESHKKAKESYDRQVTRRERQEAILIQLVSFVTPAVVAISAIFISLMTWLNVRERRCEIGLLRALGKQSPAVAGLFLGKAVMLGLIGGAVGCVLAYVVVNQVAGRMEIAAENFQLSNELIVYTLLGAPLVAAIASYIPTLLAVRQDPAVVLMDH